MAAGGRGGGGVVDRGWVPFELNLAVSAPQTAAIARPSRAGAIYMSLRHCRLDGSAHRSRRLDGFMGRGGAKVTPTGIIPCKTYR